MRKLIRKIALRLIKYCEDNNKVFVITGTPNGGEKVPYLVRYLVINTKYFCFYIHRFLRSDHDGPHDHPWSFFTYVIDGGYTEEQYKPNIIYKPEYRYIEQVKGKTDFIIENNRRKPGSLAFKSCKDVHKVVLDKEYTIKELNKAPLTMCFIGPRQRDWGFWDGQEKRKDVFGNRRYLGKWVLWTDFLGIEPDVEKRG